MIKYVFSLVFLSLILGFLSYVSYLGALDKTVKNASAVLLLFAIATPFGTLLRALSEFDAETVISGFIEDAKSEIDSEQKYEAVAEEAFCDGVSKLVAEKYGIEKEFVKVRTVGYDFEKMRALKVKVILSGAGAFSDTIGIEEYLNTLSLGECEVYVDFG